MKYETLANMSCLLKNVLQIKNIQIILDGTCSTTNGIQISKKRIFIPKIRPNHTLAHINNKGSA